jgi:flagellar biosynthesis protein FliQ
MTPETVMTVAHRALEITLLLSAPLLLCALVVGLLVGYSKPPRRSTK